MSEARPCQAFFPGSHFSNQRAPKAIGTTTHAARREQRAGDASGIPTADESQLLAGVIILLNLRRRLWDSQEWSQACQGWHWRELDGHSHQQQRLHSGSIWFKNKSIFLLLLSFIEPHLKASSFELEGTSKTIPFHVPPSWPWTLPRVGHHN